MNDSRPPKFVWTVIKEFEANGIVAEVSESDSSRPRYTVRVGRRGERDGQTYMIPHLHLYTEGQGQITVASISDTIAGLVEQAEQFVQERAQQHENAFVEARAQYDRGNAARDRSRQAHRGGGRGGRRERYENGR